MSAGSRKKHSNAHKGFNAGNQDHLEVSAMIAGAGNGRDVEERLGGAAKMADKINNPPPPEDGVMGGVNTQEGKSMARMADAILKPGDLNAPAPELDLKYGGIPGYVPPEGSLQYAGKNIIAVLVRNVKPNLFPEGFGEQLKNVIELQAVNIDGLRTGFTMIGGRLRQESSEAKYTIVEREDRANDKLLHKWADLFNNCPTVEERERMTGVQKQQAITIEDVTIDVMFIEPDWAGTKVNVAWFGKNLYPHWYSGIESYRELGDTRVRGLRLQFSLAGDYQRAPHIESQAQELFDKILALPSSLSYFKTAGEVVEGA